jgi:hypothetical protein
MLSFKLSEFRCCCGIFLQVDVKMAEQTFVFVSQTSLLVPLPCSMSSVIK